MNKKIGNLFKGDKVIWMVFFFLCMISIVEVFSASSGLTYKSQNYVGPIAYHTFTILAGVVVAIITLNIPCRYFKLMTPFLILISVVTLLWVLLAGTKVGDAGRWINLFGFTFQPSEIAKGTIVLAVAQILAAMQRENGADKKAFKWILWILLPACVLIGLENLSTAAMLFAVVFLMMFIGLVPIKQLGKLAAVIVVLGVMALSMVMLVGHDISDEEKVMTKTEQLDQPKQKKNFVEKMFHRADTWKSRLMKFGKPKPTPQEYDLDKDAQVAHANIAIVSSGVIGKGPGQSTERDFLSQAFSDFIYAIVIEELGVLYRRDDGSVWCDLTGDGLDEKLLLRRDGTSVYMTQDLGTALLRHNDFDADRLVYVVGNEQDYHFKVLKLILGKLGFPWAEKVYHLSYGMVELPNGKMKSREGTVVDADDLIADMEQTAEQMSLEHGKNDELSDDERKRLYHILALGALKYFILKVDPTKNMLFNPAESIDFNGNTGPFIQYTYARIRSIVRKAQTSEATNQSINQHINISTKEREIIKLLHTLPSTVGQAAQSLSPAMVANYAYDLAKAFNSFYQDTPILREENEEVRNFRVVLCDTVATALRNTMTILGIEVPERM